jgi:thioredoxin:protein disulfide reductase
MEPAPNLRVRASATLPRPFWYDDIMSVSAARSSLWAPQQRRPGRLLGLLLIASAAAWSTAWADPLTRAGSDVTGILGGTSAFLHVDEAFALSARRADDGSVQAHWQIAEGYYLYRHAFEVTTDPGSAYRLGEIEVPPGEPKVDEFFGAVEVYYGDARLRAPVTGADAAGRPLVVALSYQGCADAGLCYAPETRRVSFEPGSTEGLVLAASPARASATGPGVGPVPAPPAMSEAGQAPITGIGSAFSEEGQLASYLGRAALPAALALFFLAGVGLALTPCVLPMVPILSSIIVGQGAGITQLRAFTLSLSYVLGMAFTYAIIGTLMGLFGAGMNIQAALQAPAVLVTFAAVFALLALSMFGFYELRMPARWQNRVDAASRRQHGGHHGGVAVMGALSSLIVSPCISAPLAGALIYISASGDAAVGGLVLLALALGMGAPLLVLGTTGGQLLPKVGPWMNAVKAVFGVGMLGVAIWLLDRVLSGPVTLLLWSLLAIACGVYLGALDFSPRHGWGQLWKATGSVSFIYGVLLLIGSASGGDNPFQPLHRLADSDRFGPGIQAQDWRPVKGLNGLEAGLRLAAADGRPVLLDLYADWCISCKQMERNVFPDPAVSERMAQFTLLRADVTANDAEDRALLQAYGLFGPPSFLFFTSDGEEFKEFRIQGEVDRHRFSAHLERLLTRYALGS